MHRTSWNKSGAGHIIPVLVLVLSVAGCGKPSSASQSISNAPGDASSSAFPETTPAPYVETQSIASFVKGTLTECADFTVQVLPPPDAGADWMRQVSEDTTKLLPDDKGMLRIAKPCAEQFRDRTALASCNIVISGTGKRTGTVRIFSRYYDFSSLDEDDLYMKQCLEAHGDWQAVSRESNEYRRARLRANARKLGKIADKAIE